MCTGCIVLIRSCIREGFQQDFLVPVETKMQKEKNHKDMPSGVNIAVVAHEGRKKSN